jgi:SAM-dependent methyltransferase
MCTRLDNHPTARMTTYSEDSDNVRRPHPLADALIARVGIPDAYVLEIGSGSGRNTAALREAGLRVHAIDDADATDFSVQNAVFDAALSTHAFLHGTPAIIERMLSSTARALKGGAPFYCTFASKSDARYGSGVHLDADTYAPRSGEEAGVAHVYFDKDHLTQILEPSFVVESLTEENVDAIVGSWAHPEPAPNAVHWFLLAHSRQVSIEV